jgi:hypothetical protein
VGGYAAGNRMSMHTVKKDSWNRTLSAVDLPKAFDRSNAPIYGLDCRALALFVLTVSIDV